MLFWSKSVKQMNGPEVSREKYLQQKQALASIPGMLRIRNLDNASHLKDKGLREKFCKIVRNLFLSTLPLPIHLLRAKA